MHNRRAESWGSARVPGWVCTGWNCRISEATMQKLIAPGTDWHFLKDVKNEMKW